MSSVAALELSSRHEAHEPPEERGLRRDEVRMLVSERAGPRLRHARFRDLPDYLDEGDLLVINTSGTLPAELDAEWAGGERVELHFSTRVQGTPPPRAGIPFQYVVELRRERSPLFDARAGEWLTLPAGGSARLVAPYLQGRADGTRLWVAEVELPVPLVDYLARYGRPISYPYVHEPHPIAAYQTAFATEPGSAEMPSAGRPFTPELVTRLVASGVMIAPVILHTGVSSLELGEPPYPESYRVPAATARLVGATRAWGGRVIAVGTTVVRALESAAGRQRPVDPSEGWTELVITPDRGVRVVDGLLTGWHDPEASHLDMLEAIGGSELIARTYAAAAEAGYLWHEFGDVNLILTQKPR